MPTPSSPDMVPIVPDTVATPNHGSDLLSEILAAEADFERGDYIDLTPEQLERATKTGEFPWPDEFLD